MEQIGYIRLINYGSRFVYFEIPLVTKNNPQLFNPADYEWKWSQPKKTTKKEQLPAFHGYRRATNAHTFAWHGQGENQLHFSGESVWWPNDLYAQQVRFDGPTEAEIVSLHTLTEWLAQL